MEVIGYVPLHLQKKFHSQDERYQQIKHLSFGSLFRRPVTLHVALLIFPFLPLSAPLVEVSDAWIA